MGWVGLQRRGAFSYAPVLFFPVRRSSRLSSLLKPTEMSYYRKFVLIKRRVEEKGWKPLLLPHSLNYGLLFSFKRIDCLTSREVSKVLLLRCKKSTSKISGLIMFNIRI